MNTKADETAIARSVPDEAAPPPDPLGLARLLLEQLAAIPWVGLGAIGTGFGVGLLAFYFRSIDFVPDASGNIQRGPLRLVRLRHLPQLSFNPVTRLNTALPPTPCSTRSATKYPCRSNWNLSSGLAAASEGSTQA
jgi:hypothetical protein